jgi:O-antigen ligase
MIEFTTSAAAFAPPGPGYAPSSHLHNDLADFAVIGGLLGLICYGLLLAAPFAGGLATRGRHRHAALYLGVLASLGYLSMGLTNAMFGILTQTVVYGVLLALIAALAQLGQEDQG